MASHTALSPIYGAYSNPHHSAGALIRSNVVDEPVVEHEHHHVHHHIDHGNVNVSAQVAVRPRVVQREYSYDDLHDRERRYGSGASLGSLHHHHHNYGHHGHHGHQHRGARSDIDLTLGGHHMRGHYDLSPEELTIIDVPAGTRRVTVDMRERDITWRRGKGVRRSRGLGGELWTEITKDLVTREAIEDAGYAYEETEFFYYIFEYLSHEQIRELVDITREIRQYRVRDLEYGAIAGRERRGGALEWDHESTRTEIIVEGRAGGHSGRRRRNRYYY